MGATKKGAGTKSTRYGKWEVHTPLSAAAHNCEEHNTMTLTNLSIQNPAHLRPPQPPIYSTTYQIISYNEYDVRLGVLLGGTC